MRMENITGSCLFQSSLDRLNKQLEPYPDGTFDFVAGYTIAPDQVE